MLYYTEINNNTYCELIDGMSNFISLQRLEKTAKYRFFEDKILSLASYLLLRAAMSLDFGYKDIPIFSFTPNGKPMLSNNKNIYFNLSHCRNGAACAVSNTPVGVDIQDYTKYDSDIADEFMNIQEKKTAAASSEFTRIWTLKESYGKYHGYGICYDMSDIIIDDGIPMNGLISQSFLLNSFALSVTSAEKMSPLYLSADRIKHICMRLDAR